MGHQIFFADAKSFCCTAFLSNHASAASTAIGIVIAGSTPRAFLEDLEGHGKRHWHHR
jgi:hypothetical protein